MNFKYTFIGYYNKIKDTGMARGFNFLLLRVKEKNQRKIPLALFVRRRQEAMPNMY